MPLHFGHREGRAANHLDRTQHGQLVGGSGGDSLKNPLGRRRLVVAVAEFELSSIHHICAL